MPDRTRLLLKAERIPDFRGCDISLWRGQEEQRPAAPDIFPAAYFELRRTNPFAQKSYGRFTVRQAATKCDGRLLTTDYGWTRIKAVLHSCASVMLNEAALCPAFDGWVDCAWIPVQRGECEWALTIAGLGREFVARADEGCCLPREIIMTASYSSEEPLLWQAATPTAAAELLEMMRSFYVAEGLRFDEAKQGVAVRELLTSPSLGRVFLLRTRAGVETCGYLVLTWSCSLEFGGRFVLLDELFLKPEVRERGEGRRAVAFAAEWARAEGAKALRLEVAHENARARTTYGKAGLVAQPRDMMTLRLD